MRLLILPLALLLWACAAAPKAEPPRPDLSQPVVYTPSPAEYPPACSVRFAANPNIAAWSADKFVGVYRSNARTLTVRREGNALLVEQPDQLATQINSDSVESWLFRDGCGTSYQFMLPPDGPGAWLTVTTPAGTKGEWQRSGY